jgi:hypothetical protein
MPTYPGVDQLPVPNTSEIPDGPGAFLQLAQRITQMKGAGIGYALTNSARVALQSPDPVTGVVAVFPGFLCYDAQDNFVYQWNGTAWVGGQKVQHTEFTSTSASVASATVAAVGTVTVDASKTNLGSFASGGTSLVTFNEAGLYQVEVVGSIPAAPTGNFFVRGTDPASNIYQIYGNVNSGAISGVLVGSLVAAAGDTLSLSFFHTSAAARVLTLRTKVTKIGQF